MGRSTRFATSAVALATGLLLGAPAATATAAPTAAATAAPVLTTSPCTAMTTPLLESSNAATDARFHATTTAQAASVVPFGYTQRRDSGVRVSMRAATGLVPVTRMYSASSRDWLWTTSTAIVRAHLAKGYITQGAAFYALPPASTATCATAYHLLGKGTAHRLAPAASVATLVAAGWTNEGAVFRAPRPALRAVSTPGDSVFTISVTPDTQDETYASSNSRMAQRSQWLVANKARLDLRYNLHVGDVTSWGWLDQVQLDRASHSFDLLTAGGIPFSTAVGNHDTAAVDVGGSAYVFTHPEAPATTVSVRNTDAFNATFPLSRFAGVGGAFEEGRSDNVYSTFTAGNRSWLVLTLELWPRKEVVAWARSVVESHPDHLVMVLTHSYLEASGAISQGNGGYGATSPQYLYDNLVKVYPNIRFVFSGHVGKAVTRVDTGLNGNRIISMLTAFHSTSNPVRLVEIDTAGQTVSTWIHAPQDGANWPAFSKAYGGVTF